MRKAQSFIYRPLQSLAREERRSARKDGLSATNLSFSNSQVRDRRRPASIGKHEEGSGTAGHQEHTEDESSKQESKIGPNET
jgi:hypothetical protein